MSSAWCKAFTEWASRRWPDGVPAMVLNAAIEGWEAAWKLQEDILKRQAQQDLMIGGLRL